MPVLRSQIGPPLLPNTHKHPRTSATLVTTTQALPRGGTVSWPWVPARGSLEPPRQDGETAQKTGENGEEMGEIWSKTCEHRKGQEGSTGWRTHCSSLVSIPSPAGTTVQFSPVGEISAPPPWAPNWSGIMLLYLADGLSFGSYLRRAMSLWIQGDTA